MQPVYRQKQVCGKKQVSGYSENEFKTASKSCKKKIKNTLICGFTARLLFK
jgi:hypothetical protein